MFFPKWIKKQKGRSFTSTSHKHKKTKTGPSCLACNCKRKPPLLAFAPTNMKIFPTFSSNSLFLFPLSIHHHPLSVFISWQQLLSLFQRTHPFKVVKQKTSSTLNQTPPPNNLLLLCLLKVSSTCSKVSAFLALRSGFCSVWSTSSDCVELPSPPYLTTPSEKFPFFGLFCLNFQVDLVSLPGNSALFCFFQ